MILTVTPNAALEKTYHASEPTLGAAHHTEEAHAEAGGKGLDVARALAGTGVAVARSTGQHIEESWRCSTPFSKAFRSASECVLPQACNQQMSSQAPKEGER
jgi:hypothetical protein